LIGDISKFEAVHKKMVMHMGRMWEDKNCLRALNVEGFLNDLKDMSKKLDDS